VIRTHIRRSARATSIVMMTALLTAMMSACGGPGPLISYLKGGGAPGEGVAAFLDFALGNGCAWEVYVFQAGVDAYLGDEMERPDRREVCVDIDPTAAIPVVIELVGPGGDVRRSQTLTSSGTWYLEVGLSDPLGSYVVRFRSGEHLTEAVIEVGEASRPRVLALQNRAPAGTTFLFEFAGLAAQQDLYVYRLFDEATGECGEFESREGLCWKYVSNLPAPSVDPDGRGTFQVPTLADDPPGLYLVSAEKAPTELFVEDSSNVFRVE
jgi:hypothetical protein